MQGEIKGTGLTPFCAIGRLHFYSPSASRGVQAHGKAVIGGDTVTAELSRLEIAAAAARERLEEEAALHGDHSEILDEIFERSREEIFRGMSARGAVISVSEALFLELARGSDPHVSSGSSLCAETAAYLLREFFDEGDDSVPRLPSPVILIADDITEKELEGLDRSMLLGLILCDARPLSPSARLAHSLGIPLIVGCKEMPPKSELEGRIAVIDGEKGVILTEPEGEVIEHYALRLGEFASKKKDHKARGIKRLAVIERADELDGSLYEEADGIGLLRADRLIEAGVAEREHLFSLFSSLAESMGGREVRILLPTDEELYKLTLDAAARASEHGSVSVIMPSVTSPSVMQRLRCDILSLDKASAEELRAGAMIENGAALMTCGEIAAVSDLLTVDCDSLLISLLSSGSTSGSPTQKAIEENGECLIKALGMISDACRKAGIFPGVCGTLAASKKLRDRLLRLGINELILHPPYLF